MTLKLKRGSLHFPKLKKNKDLISSKTPIQKNMFFKLILVIYISLILDRRLTKSIKVKKKDPISVKIRSFSCKKKGLKKNIFNDKEPSPV